jgi:hypothetical protein
MRDHVLSAGPRPIEQRKIRFDTVAEGGAMPRAESRSLLGLFRLWGGAPTPERRRSPRHEVVEAQVWLGWWRGERGFLASSAVLINLSRGGAFVFVDERPPQDEPVWISLGMPDPVGFVESRVVAVKVSRQGQCAVRLEFRAPCPYGFFEAAVCGLPPADPKSRFPRPTEASPGFPYDPRAARSSVGSDPRPAPGPGGGAR